MVVIFSNAGKMKIRIFLLLFFLFLLPAFVLPLETVSALEYVHFRHRGKERNEEGRIILEESAGIALETRDSRLYVISPRNLISRRSDDVPFTAYTKAEMIERLRVEFPPDEKYGYLDTHDPFIVVYTTEQPFANWCGNLLKKLYEQYTLHWKRLGVELAAPEFPLVAVVLSSEERYRQFAEQDGVTLSPEQCAYYHKLTNRIVMYDMSGQQVFREGNRRRTTAADIQRFLTQPGSYNNIMAVIHEAAHQVGYNTGMHPRHAPNPVWICEGLAIFHEVPDPKNRQIGWTLGPHVNRYRLEQLRRYLGKPNLESPIQQMIQNDSLFRKPDTAFDNYALAWGVTYYLFKRRPKELTAYLKILQEKTSESDDSDEIRIKDFESCFGENWNAFYRDFFDFLRRL